MNRSNYTQFLMRMFTYFPDFERIFAIHFVLDLYLLDQMPQGSPLRSIMRRRELIPLALHTATRKSWYIHHPVPAVLHVCLLPPQRRLR